jgi:hypothetical protein
LKIEASFNEHSKHGVLRKVRHPKIFFGHRLPRNLSHF